MIKKYILGALLALSIPLFAYASSMPVLSVSGTGGAAPTLTVTGGDPNVPVVLYYNPSAGNVQTLNLGTTDQNGYWSGTVSTSANGISWNLPIYAQVGGYQTKPWNAASTTLTFSMSSPMLTVGQNGVVYLSGGNGTYYISSNSNSSGISAGITGNTLNLYGGQAGTGNIEVCSTGGGCGTLAVTVNTSGSSTSNSTSPMLSQSALQLGFGGQGSITLSGGTSPYTVTVPSGSGITTTMIGNTLYVNGNASGSTTVQVCSANGGGCTPLNVTVGTSSTGSTGGTTSNGSVGISLPVNVGSPVQLMLTGGTGSYYISTPSSLALASINGNTLTLNPSAVGSGTLSVCSSSSSNCTPIAFTVSPALTGTGGGYFYDNDLSLGMSGQDVSELQSRLATEGYFGATATGYFGPVTEAAVKAYQSAHGISATGYVGPLTRAELNK